MRYYNYFYLITIILLPCFSGAQAYGRSIYGSGPGPIAFTGFQCTGNEADLLNCSRNSSNSCSSKGLAGVSCRGKPLGRCETSGFTGCCTESCKAEGDPLCYCSPDCHNFIDCCNDFKDICPMQGS